MYLNLVLDFVPETVYRVARHFNKAKTTIPIIYVKVSGPQRSGQKDLVVRLLLVFSLCSVSSEKSEKMLEMFL